MSSRGLKQKKAICFVVIFVMMAFFGCWLGFGTHAQTTTSSITEGVDIIEGPLGLPATDIRLIIARIIRVALSLLGIITVILMMYGGYMWMTAGGNEEQIGKSKKILINAVIGLLIILSAYSIVLFVMKMLGVGDNSAQFTKQPPGSEHFQGSGALGRIIKDHYPERDQTDVARNTKIVISFFKPIMASSTIDDTNGNGIYGDCLPTTPFDWSNEQICDRLKTGDGKLAQNGIAGGELDDKYINITDAKTGLPIKSAVVLASKSTVKGVTGVYILVIKPLTDLSKDTGGYLGSPTEDLGYKVHIGPEIRLDDPINDNPKIFEKSNLGDNYYEWQFICGTSLDLTPPTVTSVYPAQGDSAPKNSIIQINFSEAMDPTGLQGSFQDKTGYYQLENGHIYLKSDNSNKQIGSFTLTNGYRTLEFVSDKECEQKNACGNTMFCLSVCDKSGVKCVKYPIYNIGKPTTWVEADNFNILVKSAITLGGQSFEAKPFSGAMDLAGNALDGNKNSKVDTAPTTGSVFPDQEKPDNFYWQFYIRPEIDLTSPFLSKTTPGPDASYIEANHELSMEFSRPMRADAMYNIKIEEYATEGEQSKIPICYVPRTKIFANSTYVEIRHCPFLFAKRFYYIPTVPAEVEDVNFNCYYPGKGPDSLDISDPSKSSKICDGQNNCCNVSTNTPGQKDLCCNGMVQGFGYNYFSTTTCANVLKNN
ncbi:MAG: Ig-like domain-containing protein [bacterium]